MEMWQLFLAIASFCLSLVVSVVGGAIWISKAISHGNALLGEQIDSLRQEVGKVRIDFTKEIREIRDNFVSDDHCQERRNVCVCSASYNALSMEVSRQNKILEDVRRRQGI